LDIEYEVMIMGGRCHFNDELCFTWHSGAGRNFCNYFSGVLTTSTRRRFPPGWKQVLCDFLDSGEPMDEFAAGSAVSEFRRALITDAKTPETTHPIDADGAGDDGMSSALAFLVYGNCGLCAIPRLREIGIDALKIISRGEDWRKRHYLRAVRAVVDNPDATPEFCRSLIDSPGFCAAEESCYYDLRDIVD